MSLGSFKERLIAILLFFKEYMVLIYCFTLLILSISSSKLIERVLFENEILNLESFIQIFLPILIFLTIVYVSYRVFCHVHFFTTLLKIFILSLLLIAPVTYLRYREISKSTQKVLRFTNKNVWITGVMTSKEKSNTYLFHSSGEGLGNSLVRFKGYPVLHAGQRCKIYGSVVQPKSFQEFDYKRYLFRKGIYSILEVEKYQCSNGGNIFLELRYRLERVVESAIPEPEASLLIGIMFGSKRIFLAYFNSSLSSSGVSHIIAASGYNVALVAQFVDTLTRRGSGKGVIFLKILLIWGFSVFSGLSLSLVRASTMSTLGLVALLFGRDSNRGATLILCVTFLIVLNPFVIHDVGFLFSFACVTGLLFFPKCLGGIKSKFVKESVLPTLTSILFTLPISVIFFGKVSLISLLSNIVLLPIVESTIFWGLGATVVNMFFPLKILFLVSYIQLNIFKKLVLLSSNIAMLEIGVNEYVFGISIYLFLFIFCILKYPISQDNYYILQAKKL